MPSLANTAEAPEQNSAEAREPVKSPLEQIADLLNGEEPTDQDDQVEQADGESESESEAEAPKNDKPKNLEQLAEALGVKVADLYDIEIPLGVNDENVTKTLGEFKDIVKESATFEVERLAWEEHKTQQEQRILKSNQELTDLVAMLPRSALSQSFLDAVRERRAATLATEEKRTLDVIPAWKDEKIQARDRGRMAEHLAGYGFPDNYLDGIADHRTLKYIRDNMERQERIERALEQVKTVRKPGHSPSPPPSKSAPKSRSTPRRNVRNQVAQIVDILNSETG